MSQIIMFEIVLIAASFLTFGAYELATVRRQRKA